MNIQGTVDPNTVGDYFLTFEAQDSASNLGQAFLTVHVVPDLPPTLSLIGAATLTLDCGTAYVEPGWAAVDEEDGDLTASVTVTGATPAGPLGPGAWTVLYGVTDSLGNTASAQREVVALPNCTLTVSAAGATSVTATVGSTVILSVEASGAVGDAVYQWERFRGEKAWEPILGETLPDLELIGVQYEDAGTYRCVVSDLVTTVESPVFSLVVESGLPASGSAGLALLGAFLSAGLWLGLSRRREKARARH